MNGDGQGGRKSDEVATAVAGGCRPCVLGAELGCPESAMRCWDQPIARSLCQVSWLCAEGCSPSGSELVSYVLTVFVIFCVLGTDFHS